MLARKFGIRGASRLIFRSFFCLKNRALEKPAFFRDFVGSLAILCRILSDFGSILGSPKAFFSELSEKSKTLRNHIYICFRKGRDLQNSTKNRPKKCKKTALAGNSLKIGSWEHFFS